MIDYLFRWPEGVEVLDVQVDLEGKFQHNYGLEASKLWEMA